MAAHQRPAAAAPSKTTRTAAAFSRCWSWYQRTEAPGPLGCTAAHRLLLLCSDRAYSAQPGGPGVGWLAAICDRNLARAVEAMHTVPAANWTLDLLAKQAGMSRSAFAARFKAVVGQTPLDYLTRWRIYRASRHIQRSRASVAAVAREAGYDSVAAFNRAFKRETGLTPVAFRKAAKAGAEQVG